MNVHQFIALNQSRWNQLSEFIDEAGRLTLARVPLEEFRQGSLLYRQTIADLGYARMRFPTHQVVRELEHLVGRAHSVIYQAQRVKRSDWRRFWTREWPNLVVGAFPEILTATMIFLIASVIGFVLAAEFPVLESFFISKGMRAAMDEGRLWTERITSVAPHASSAIATNNISVSIVAWALGVTFGVGTIWLLVVNGLMLGVISAGCLRAGLLAPLGEFIVAHGALELPAIWIAAGAGLVMGKAMVLPGRYSRSVELRHAGRRSARLLVGIVPMLLIAGFVEGYVSPSDLPAIAKIALAIGLIAAYSIYVLSCAGRPD